MSAEWRSRFAALGESDRPKYMKDKPICVPECRPLLCHFTAIHRDGPDAGLPSHMVYRYYCLQCGAPVGPFVGHKKLSRDAKDLSLPRDHPVVVEARKRYEATWGERSARRMSMWAEWRSARSSAWWGLYRQYLASHEWASKRRAALSRHGVKCQGESCRAAAREIHHLTYERVGDEDLDDLMPLCSACHEKWHEHAEIAQP